MKDLTPIGDDTSTFIMKAIRQARSPAVLHWLMKDLAKCSEGMCLVSVPKTDAGAHNRHSWVRENDGDDMYRMASKDRHQSTRLGGVTVNIIITLQWVGASSRLLHQIEWRMGEDES